MLRLLTVTSLMFMNQSAQRAAPGVVTLAVGVPGFPANAIGDDAGWLCLGEWLQSAEINRNNEAKRAAASPNSWTPLSNLRRCQSTTDGRPANLEKLHYRQAQDHGHYDLASVSALRSTILIMPSSTLERRPCHSTPKVNGSKPSNTTGLTLE